MNLIIGKWSFCPKPIISYLALIFVGLFITLGGWQLDRAEQKRVLFAEFEKKQAGAARHLNHEKIALDDTLTWQPVNAHGFFLEQYQILLDNQVAQGKIGYFVYTPFVFAAGAPVILVNRGWVPMGRYRQTVPELTKTNGKVGIVGIIKGEPNTGLLLNDAEPEVLSDTVYRVQRISIDDLQVLLDKKMLPYIIRLSPESAHGYRRKWQPPGSGESRHLAYAFQWFAFAAAVLVIYLVLNIKKTDA